MNISDGFYDGLPGGKSKSKINPRCFFSKIQLKEQKLILMQDEEKALMQRADEMRARIFAEKMKQSES